MDETAVRSLIAAALDQREAQADQQTNSDIEQLHQRLSNEADALSARIANLVRLVDCRLTRSSTTVQMSLEAGCKGVAYIDLAEQQGHVWMVW